MIKRIFNNFADNFTSKLESIAEKLTENFVSNYCESQSQRITALELENEQLEARIDEIETVQRSDSLMMDGLPGTTEEIYSKGESTATPICHTACSFQQTYVQSVVDFCCKSLRLNISTTNMSCSYRIPRKRKDKYRPLMVRFVNRHARNMGYASRKILRDASNSYDSVIFINEHLTKLLMLRSLLNSENW